MPRLFSYLVISYQVSIIEINIKFLVLNVNIILKNVTKQALWQRLIKNLKMYVHTVSKKYCKILFFSKFILFRDDIWDHSTYCKGLDKATEYETLFNSFEIDLHMNQEHTLSSSLRTNFNTNEKETLSKKKLKSLLEISCSVFMNQISMEKDIKKLLNLYEMFFSMSLSNNMSIEILEVIS